MNYIGSKLSFLEFIEKSINDVVWEKNYVFSDLFAWSGVVWKYFKERWHKVIANDLQFYSYILNRNYIGNHTDLYFVNLKNEIPELHIWDVSTYKESVCKYLENLPWNKWFIYKNYTLWWTNWKEFERQYFTDENAMKCDSIRKKIESWNKEWKINEDEYYFLLASLLESIDKVSNTTWLYWAFLKKFKSSSLKKMVLKPALFHINKKSHVVENMDTNKFIKLKNISHDVVYLDPPYNERQYSANYHLLETIAKYDNPKLHWKTWLRDYTEQKSDYCKKNDVLKTFDDLIQNIDAKYIFLSYNNEWLMTFDDIKNIMSKRWDYDYIPKEYKRFKADKTENRNHKKEKIIEYLHYVKVTR